MAVMATPPDVEALDALAATDALQPIPPETLYPILSSPPFVPTRSLINLRDVGSVHGSALRPGHAYRCGTLDVAARDPDAIAWLAAHVRRIFDLRKATERASAPDPEVPGVENVWADQEEEYPTPMLKDFMEREARHAWKRQYFSVAMSYRPTIRLLLEHVRDRPAEPFLFHCTGESSSPLLEAPTPCQHRAHQPSALFPLPPPLTTGRHRCPVVHPLSAAGRDRTGIVAGVLQALAGASTETIKRDYMLSRIGTEPAREKLLAFALASVGAASPDAPGFSNLVALRPEYWDAFVEGIGERFGSIEGYVTDGLCFSQESLEMIKKNLRS